MKHPFGFTIYNFESYLVNRTSRSLEIESIFRQKNVQQPSIKEYRT
ncbi:hypothetical protein KsCSTR_20690 [Candidatus Kuenenia stuttgartiensis]|uniref:Uncharacterized protein n=1 Tax=Kuenenia stuttgartiensis TaxID=174633 RepID=A0A6G7GPD1_KUEST|nr:hypothetical protein KsCSTR_20690 [Candidatus Kuenenia stuttgartiensis]